MVFAAGDLPWWRQKRLKMSSFGRRAEATVAWLVASEMTQSRRLRIGGKKHSSRMQTAGV